MKKISTIKIRNFKFYIDETINIDSYNFLFYGENGVGKSSLYQSLYSLFYGYFDNNLLQEIENLKNRNQEDNIFLEVSFSNDEVIKIDKQNISNSVSILEKQNIYFLDYRFLETFINQDDFFITLETFQNRFLLFNNIFSQIKIIENTIADDNPTVIVSKRQKLDSEIIELLEKIKIYTNEIILELKETFTIDLEFTASNYNDTGISKIFNKPKINITIDCISDFKSHFNESKIKILSLSIIFALIKLNQEKYPSSSSDNLKLLVIDDFLSSLDMGNRLYIMEYIFKNFENYQKIILTHNSLFFNIIKRLIHVHNDFNKWKYKHIYQSLRDDNLYEPKIFKERDYLKEANDAFDDSDYETCGNLLRKEVEKTIAFATFLFRTGKKETLEDAITHIRKKEKHYINSNDILKDINIFYENFKNNQYTNEYISIENKLSILMNELDSRFDMPSINSNKLNEILESINFYQTILNQASHYDDEADCYKIEYQEALTDVKRLKEILNEFN